MKLTDFTVVRWSLMASSSHLMFKQKKLNRTLMTFLNVCYTYIKVKWGLRSLSSLNLFLFFFTLLWSAHFFLGNKFHHTHRFFSWFSSFRGLRRLDINFSGGERMQPVCLPSEDEVLLTDPKPRLERQCLSFSPDPMLNLNAGDRSTCRDLHIY